MLDAIRNCGWPCSAEGNPVEGNPAEKGCMSGYAKPALAGVIAGIAGGTISGLGFWLAGATVCSMLSLGIAVTPLTITATAIIGFLLIGGIAFAITKCGMECHKRCAKTVDEKSIHGSIRVLHRGTFETDGGERVESIITAGHGVLIQNSSLKAVDVDGQWKIERIYEDGSRFDWKEV